MAEIKFYLQKYLSEFRQRLNDNTLKLNDIHAILSFFDKMNHTSYCKRDRLSQREADSILKVNFNSLKTAYNDWKNRNNTTSVKTNTVNNSYQCDNTNIDKYKEMEKVSQELLRADDYAYGEIDESIPKKCECGGKIITKLYAEPVRVCEKCGKYYETIPFKRKKKKMNESKNIILTESQMNYIKEHLNEDGKAIIKYFVEPEKTLIIKKFLDDNFVKAGMPMISPEGYPTTMPIVGLKGTDGQVAKNMTDKQLFFMLQDKFLKMYTDIDRRDRFLKQLIKDWYYDKISKEGLLSVNEY